MRLAPPLKCVVAFEARGGQTSVRVITDQRPVAIIIFIPKRQVPLPVPFEIEVGDIRSTIVVSINSEHDGVRFFVRNDLLCGDFAAAIYIVSENVGIVGFIPPTGHLFWLA